MKSLGADYIQVAQTTFVEMHDDEVSATVDATLDAKPLVFLKIFSQKYWQNTTQ